MPTEKELSDKVEALSLIMAPHLCNELRYCSTCKRVVPNPTIHLAMMLAAAGVELKTSRRKITNFPTTPTSPIDLHCPTCLAKPGQKCISLDTHYVLIRFHADRISD